ncbi:MAG: multiheme c-type cytochrome [Fidelibacterota bacterium]
MKIKHLLLLTVIISATPIRSLSDNEPQYVGVKKCQICHATPEIGDQYGIWKLSKHAQAFATLLSEESLKIAKERGLTVLPHEAPECLECHVTGYGADDSKFESPQVMELGIQCESCHGPGSEYKKISIMLDREQSLANGLIIPTEETCIKCHNERSPRYKSFHFEDFVKKIDHKVPEGYSWEEDDDEDEDEELW